MVDRAGDKAEVHSMDPNNMKELTQEEMKEAEQGVHLDSLQ